MEGVEIGAEGPFDLRAQHLHRHLFAGCGKASTVNLRNRGGGNRIGELGEDLVDLDFELGFDGFAGHICREGRQLVLQIGELFS